MPAGLEIISDSGSILIDANWANYSLFSVETLTSSKNAWGELDRAGVVHQSSQPADLVFASAEVPILPVCIVTYNGVRQYRVGTGGSEGVPVRFFTFRKQPPRNSAFGVQVFDAGGNLVFDALDKRCRMAGVVPAAELGQSKQFNFGSGRKYAVLVPTFTGQLIEQDSGAGQGNMAWKYLTTNSPLISLNASGVALQGYSVSSVRQIPIQNPKPGVIISNFTGGDYLVCDIAGY